MNIIASRQLFVIIGCEVQKNREDNTDKHVQERGFTTEKSQTNGYKVPKSKSH